MENQDRIDAYLRNEMTPLQREDFERDLDTDATLKQEFELTKEIAGALAERDSVRKKIEAYGDEARVAEKRGRVIRWVSASIAAAAALILVAVSPWTFRSQEFTMPTFDEPVFGRGNLPVSDVDSLIHAGKYARALELADSLCLAYGDSLKRISGADSVSREDRYIQKVLEADLYSLTWRRINLMMAQGKKKEASRLNETFMKKEGRYRAEAEELQKKIRK